MKLEERIAWLKANGCTPSIYARGEGYRAHVNAAGNFWADAKTPRKAMEDAVRLWKSARCPLDGTAGT